MSEPAATELSAREVRARAVSGVVRVSIRNVAVRLIGLAGTIVLARLLEPRDYGVLALGMTVRTFGAVIASGGLGAALLRRPEPPTRAELRAVQGFQLAGTMAIALGFLAAGLWFGGAIAVAAVTVLSLPIQTASAPSRILLERELDWKLQSRVEVSTTVVFQVAAVLLVLVGFGVWGVAVAFVVESIVTLAALVIFGPIGFMWPSFSLRTIRPILRFGLQFQAISIISAVRDQGLNTLLAIVGGVATLGIWTISYRLLQAIVLFLGALQRVAFPALARMFETGEDPGPTVTRAMRVNAVVLGVPAVLLGGTAPALVPALLGEKWIDAVSVLPWCSAALLISAPVTAVGTPFLQAAGDGGRTLRVIAFQTVVWLVAAAALTPFLGAQGAGIGMFLGAIALSVSVMRALRHHIRISPGVTTVPYLCALGGAIPAWVVADTVSPPLLGLIVSGALGVATFVAALAVTRRADLELLVRLVRQGVRSPAGSSS